MVLALIRSRIGFPHQERLPHQATDEAIGARGRAPPDVRSSDDERALHHRKKASAPESVTQGDGAATSSSTLTSPVQGARFMLRSCLVAGEWPRSAGPSRSSPAPCSS